MILERRCSMRKTMLALAVIVILVGALALIFGFTKKPSGELVDPKLNKLVENVPKTLKVTVNAIGSDGRFLKEYTCDGVNKPPIVQVSDIPSEAKSLALIMYDPDAPRGTFIHWLLVATPEGGETTLTGGSGVEGRNDFGQIGYGGPCPPRGHGVHRYFIMVLALDEKPELREGFSLSQLLDAVKGHVIAWGYSMGTYSR
jgi:Raf kinase inhibitor-like YbhB/YbcL family protein